MTGIGSSSSVASPYALAGLGGMEPAAPAWFADAVAAPFEQVPLDHDGARLELLCWGEVGRPGLLLLHGNNAHARWWSPIAARLAGGFRVAALSWSGMGGSGWRQAYSIAGYADEAMAACRAAGLFAAGRPVVAAHSFGGSPALEAALRHGDDLAGVIVLDSLLDPVVGKPDLPVRARHPVYPSLEAGLARFRLAPAQPCENLYYIDWVARHGLLADEDGEWTWRIDPGLWPKVAWHDKWSALVGARCPLALVRGGSSKLVTPQGHAAAHAAAPPGTLAETIAEAGHHLLLDRPLEVVETVDRIARGFLCTSHQTCS